MRILLTVHQFLPDFHTGTEILAFDTARALQVLGHEVAVFTGYPAGVGVDDAQRFDRYTQDGIAVERFHYNRAPMGGWRNIAALEYDNPFLAAYFRGYLERTRPDVVHFFHLQRLSASVIDVCRDLGLPMILTPTDFWLVCPTNQLLLPDNALCPGPAANGVNCLRHVAALTQPAVVNAGLALVPDRLLAAAARSVGNGLLPDQKHASYVRALLERPRFIQHRMRHVERITVPTRLMAEVLAKNGIDKTKMMFLPFGIDMKGLSQRTPASPQEKLCVGFIGTLYEHKGAHVLIAAVRSLPPELPIEVRLYGDPTTFPQYMARLHQMAASDSRFTFCGTFPHEEIGNVYASFDVLVVPSIWHENAPLVIYVAQACGCPVVASNLGGLSEGVGHEENGLLFEAGNAKELARALRRLTDDRALLRRLGQNARMPKSIGQYAVELENLYREILAERRAA